MDELTKLLGQKIKFLRKSKKLLQSELAEKIGVEAKYLSRLETGLSSPSLKTIQNLAKALNVEIQALFDFPNDVPDEVLKAKIFDKINMYDSNQLKMLSSLIKFLDSI